MKTELQCRAHFRDLTALTTPLPWTHIVPKGEFPGMVEIPAGYHVPGYGVAVEDMEIEGITVLGDAQLERMVQGFKGDMLIDSDHLSHDQSQSTEANGWGQELRYMADRSQGLELATDWTPPGKEKIITGIYRKISPEFSGAVKYEDGTFKFYPTALTGAGLTNRPKLTTLKPVSVNREKKLTSTTTMDYKSELCKTLGLDPATATDAEIAAKLGSESATSANRATRLTLLEAENKTLKDAAIENDLAIFADVIEDKEAAKELLQMNRESTVKLFRAAQAKKGTSTVQDPIYQKNRAIAPTGEKFTEAEEQKATAKFRAISGRATQLTNEARSAGKSRDWNSCWAQAEAEAGV